MYTIGDCFAGIGGFSLVFHHFGCETKWFIEYDSYCQQVLRKHFNVPIHGNIFDCHNLPHVDIFTAGFPCQPFSVAGQQMGVEDERYLVPEMLRVISEVKPYVILLENVPGFASLDNGNAFKYLLRTLAEMGYDALWGHLRASDSGAPHKRERWFCVAYRQRARGQGREVQTRNVSTSLARGKANPLVSSSNAMAYPTSPRRHSGQYPKQKRYVLRGRKRNAAQGQSERSGRLYRVRSFGKTLANPACQFGTWDKQERDCRGQSQETLRDTGGNRGIMENANGKRQRHTSNGHGALAKHSRASSLARTNGQSQSAMGRDIDGLSAPLDRHQFPAPPSLPQHASEPSRITTQTKNRQARLKALGNSIVPQAWLPIAEMIIDFLEHETC